MALQDELKELTTDMISGKGYQTFYQMGLGIPFLYFIDPTNFGNIEVLSTLSDDTINNLSSKDTELLNKIGGLYQVYMELVFLNENLNLDWFESLELIVRNKGYLYGVPVKFYLEYQDTFNKYCEFLLCKNDYNFVPTENEKEQAKQLALTHTSIELNHVLGMA